MALHFYDWLIVGGLMAFVTFIAVFTQKYVKNVAGYLAANRCAGRYLLTLSEGMSNLGAISLIALFQMSYQAGFTSYFWQMMNMPVNMLLVISGFVIYRLRQTRALTLAEFLERRYSRNFRIFAGIIIFISGVVNFGIFPSVGSRFFIYFCGLPDAFQVAGLTISTYPFLMIVLLVVSLYFTFIGGLIVVMVTDFFQGMFSSIVFLIIGFFALYAFGLGGILDGISISEPGQSMINPYKGQNIPEFNVWFFVMTAFLHVYGRGAWQGSQGYRAAALTPHEAKMGGIISGFRTYSILLVTILLPLVAYTVMHHPEHSAVASQSNEILSGIANEEVRDQMTVPIVMRLILPIGLKGLFCAVFLAAFISTHDTYMHSWASVFVQDVVMPFRKTPMDQKTHMWVLRASVVGVTVFIFIFSMLFRQTDKILLWMQLSGAIYLAGAGAVIIGGLYWKKGTTLAAYVALIVGATLSITGIVYRQYNPDFFLNAMQMAFLSAFGAGISYFLVALIQNKKVNMDKVLHMGKFRVKEDHDALEDENPGFLVKLGLTKELKGIDKIIVLYMVAQTLLFVSLFVGINLYHFVINPLPDAFWLTFWKIYVIWTLTMGVIFTTWLLIGGLVDIRKLFQRLSEVVEGTGDDGWVSEEEHVEEKDADDVMNDDDKRNSVQSGQEEES